VVWEASGRGTDTEIVGLTVVEQSGGELLGSCTRSFERDICAFAQYMFRYQLATQNTKINKHSQFPKGTYSLVKETDAQTGYSSELKG